MFKPVTTICIFLLVFSIIINCDDNTSSSKMSFVDTKKTEVSASIDTKKTEVNDSADNTKVYFDKPRWVKAEEGLNLRVAANPRSKVIDTIPYGDVVRLLWENGGVVTISGVEGKWSEVRWKEHEG